MPVPRLVVGALVAMVALVVAARGVLARGVDYDREVRPILSDKCFPCHGPDEAARQAGLRLDLREAALASGVITPGDAAASELWRRVSADDEAERMPPPDAGLQLDAVERQTLRDWIAEGAGYRPHWAFEPLPEDVPVPLVNDPSWPRGPLDQFVLAQLEQQGWRPSRPASRERWLRRVTLDLTGLPPTPDEVDAFVADNSAQAFENVAYRLLASPRFGERMATPWLDAARYADSYGYQSDQLCATWPYRDFVVRAFNDNLPFDRFVALQLAGDLLPAASDDARLATAFNRLHRMTNEGGSVEEEWRNEYVADRVATFGTVFLGLTLECARCHDHKYDPITQRDFYQLYALFNSIDEWGMYNDSDHVPTPALLLPDDAQRASLVALQAEVSGAEAAERTALQTSVARFERWLAAGPHAAELPGLIGHYPMEAIEPDGNRLANLADPANPGSTSPHNRIVPGHAGNALQFTGDDEASLPGVCGQLGPGDAYAVSLWLWLPTDLRSGVVLHRSSGTDVGFFGAELTLQQGRLRFAIQRFWPGNAIAVETRREVPAERWTHVAITYDASLTAGGMAIYLDGAREGAVLRDALTKHPQAGGGGITLGQRFRCAGLRGGRIDELRAYSRPLAPVEVRQLCDGHALDDALAANDRDALLDWYQRTFDQPLAAARDTLRDARRRWLEAQTGVLEVSVMEELAEPVPTFRLARGAYDAPHDEADRVERGAPASLPRWPEGAPRNRLGLAQWLARPDHPLTARVAVNRLWRLFFGEGLVATSENFGRQGAAPSHPQLLDWLARDFVASGFDVKRLCRQIVLSATYRQDSAGDEVSWRDDPHNERLARGPSHRLSGEMIRDTALFAAGLLDERRGGPPVSPYQPAGLWQEANSMSPAYHPSVGGDLYRRSLYTVWKRTAPMPDMMAFDAATREVCTVRRSRSVTPQQALVLWNDIQFVEAARVLAERSMREASAVAGWVELAFRRLTGRRPDALEAAQLLALFAVERARFVADPSAAAALLGCGEHVADETLAPADLAALTMVVETAMNLDATVWKR